MESINTQSTATSAAQPGAGIWQTPNLTCFGSVQALTAGGSWGANECQTNCDPTYPGQPGNPGYNFYKQ